MILIIDASAYLPAQWIGLNEVLLQGVTIGRGGVVGTGSVVVKSVPPQVIVARNPARIVRELPPDER